VALARYFFFRWAEKPPRCIDSRDSGCKRAIDTGRPGCRKPHAALGYFTVFTGGAESSYCEFWSGQSCSPECAWADRGWILGGASLGLVQISGQRSAPDELAAEAQAPRSQLFAKYVFLQGHNPVPSLDRHEEALEAARQFGDRLRQVNTLAHFPSSVRAANLIELNRQTEAQAAIEMKLAWR